LRRLSVTDAAPLLSVHLNIQVNAVLCVREHKDHASNASNAGMHSMPAQAGK